MADQVNLLSIRATLASDDYVRGAQAIANANKEMSAAASDAGTNVIQFESKVSSAADKFTQFVNKVDPAAKAARQFQQDMLTLSKAIDTGRTSGDAAVNLYVALSAKLGLVANETQIASQNLTGLAQVVATGNERMRQQAETVDALALSYRQMAAEARSAQAAENANAAFNRSFGVAQPVSNSASASASVFEEQFRAQEELERATAATTQRIAQLRSQFDPTYASAQKLSQEVDALAEAERLGVEITGGYGAALDALIQKYDATGQAATRSATAQAEAAQKQAQYIAQLRAEQEGQNFSSDLNARFGIGGGASSASASASVFQEQATAVDALRAAIDPLGTSWAAMNKQIAEYEALLKSGAISVDEFAAAEDLARNRHEQLKASLGAGTGGTSSSLTSFRRTDLGFQANDVISGIISGQPIGQIAAQQGGQIFGAYQQAGGLSAVKEDLSAIGGLAATAATALGPIGIAFGVAGAAALTYYALTREQTKSTDEILKEHAENIKALGDAYGLAADQAKNFSVADQIVAQTAASKSAQELTSRNKEAINSFVIGLSSPDYSQLSVGGDADFQLKAKYKAFQGAFDDLQKSQSVSQFVNEVSGIAQLNPALQSVADELINDVKQVKALNDELTKTTAITDKLSADRGRPGIGFLTTPGPSNVADQKSLDQFEKDQATSLRQAQEAYNAQIAAITAKTPAQKQNAAIDAASAQHNPGESQQERDQRIELAGTQALIQAEHDLRQAKDDRIRASQTALDQAQYEASLTGKSVEEQNRLKAAYQAEAQIRESAARAGIDADEKEIANAKAKAAAVADLNAKIQAGKLLQDQQDQTESLQLQARLIGANADQVARETAALQEQQQLRQQGIDLGSQEAQQLIATARANASLSVEIQRQQAAYQSLQQAEGSAIDSLVSGITGAGGSFKDTLKSMAQNFLQFIDQLAIANPLKNALTGTNLPTLTDLFSGKTASSTPGVTSTAAMTVNAATVMINGSPIGAPLSGLPTASPGTLGSFLGLPGAANGVRPTLTTSGLVNSPVPLAANTNVDMAAYQQAISKIESGSFAGNYNALGPTLNSGDYAIGRYQVMASNVPSWSQKYYGQQLTADQFRANPGAQDAVFNGEFGSYVNQYGPSGAASKWFTGSATPTGRTDALGTSDNQYVKQFNQNLQQLSTTTNAAANNVTTLGSSSQTVTQSFTGLTNSLGSIGGSSASGSASGGGFFGALFHLFGFADGTDFSPGGPAAVNERGGEVINLPRGSQVIPHEKVDSYLAGRSGASSTKVDVGVTVDNDGNLKAYVKRVAHSTANEVAPAHAAAAVQAYRNEGLYSDIGGFQKDQYSRGAA